MEDCIFCKIINGEIPSNKIYESENFVAFLDIMPINPGHTLIVSKKHYENMDELPGELGEELLRVIKTVARAIVKAVNADGYNIGMNNGRAAGQLVMHAHIHIIPRFKEDGLKSWPQKRMDDSKLREIGKKIKKEIDKI
ncbi:HIT family protein [Candidatus Woesearchaeota archaeon]|nr:HIT family protein [Candidatus Woesearchaeota archaeon]